ncbi:MAG: malectin domain-containing carbohydrate-binding protein [Armatimonadetes bacterium]|nr:malectin domain-containing carbohydrate-binding protein [Armatimonadota bacterium]
MSVQERYKQACLVSTALSIVLGCSAKTVHAAIVQDRYYAHAAVYDKYGVVAPWYQGLNGVSDYRIRIAAETLKRYPWTNRTNAVETVPEYVFNGVWNIAPDGKIAVEHNLSDWNNGDMGYRAGFTMMGFVSYYRYTGDPAAIAHINYIANTILDHCQTGPNAPWPKFIISVPKTGKAYRDAAPDGTIQLDHAMYVGLGLLQAYELTGNKRWLDAAKHWGDVLAEKCDKTPGADPWGRFANPEDVRWSDGRKLSIEAGENKMTGGVVMILLFFDELERLGYTGQNSAIIQAGEAGKAYLRDKLLPKWSVLDTWGRGFWDWVSNVQVIEHTYYLANYLMDHKQEFPDWRNGVRNVMSIFINHNCVSIESMGEAYGGAWAYPESCGCCGLSVWYAPLQMAPAFARYGVEADSEWGREMARRQNILALYDVHDTGVTEDGIKGGVIVNGSWFSDAHPIPLAFVPLTMGWQPEALGASRENHIMRTSRVVNSVVYGKGRIEYSTFDAPENSLDVLRFAFAPSSVTADGKPLSRQIDLSRNGYSVKPLDNGDCIVTIRHDGCTKLVVTGKDDPQQVADDTKLDFQGVWNSLKNAVDFGGTVKVTNKSGASMTFSFNGNQVRLIGRADNQGGLADVYIDGVKQLVGIDCWTPGPVSQQVLYYKNGLPDAKHELKIVARGASNPISSGSNIYIDAVQWSDATGSAGFGEGGGPTDTQRMVFGYTGREDITDSEGNKWKPGCEFVARSGGNTDSVLKTWWTVPEPGTISGTSDQELYRYGAHAPELIVNFTVGPGSYHARLKFAATHSIDSKSNCITVLINGQKLAENVDIEATAGGRNKAVDLVFDDIAPRNGLVEIRLVGSNPAVTGVCGEAFVQAIEVGPGAGGQGAKPITVKGSPNADNLLVNPGFESGAAASDSTIGNPMRRECWPLGQGWTYAFVDSPNKCYIAPETGTLRDPNWAKPEFLEYQDWVKSEFHCGNEALRVYADGQSHAMVIQDVDVKPQGVYAASVWMKAVDLTGKGFGKNSGDSAGIRIQELDETGMLLADRGKVGLAKASPFTLVSRNFKVGRYTAKVRFILDTVLSCSFKDGYVVYDDCMLAPTGVGGKNLPMENWVP